MSGLIKHIKKHWKKKLHDFKKYWKVAAIAVAAYFTFGVALGYMGGAAAATGATTAGATAAGTGAGVFSSVGAATAATAGIETVTVTAAATGGLSAAGATAAVAAGGAAAAAGAGGGGGASGDAAATPQASTPPPTAAPPQGTFGKAVSAVKNGLKDLSFADKLLLAKSGVDLVAGLTAPSEADLLKESKKWQGAFYGTEADGSGGPAPVEGAVQKATQVARNGVSPDSPAPKSPRELLPSNDPGANPAPPGTPMPVSSFKATQEPQQTASRSEQQQVTNVGGNRDLFASRAPGVRYLV